PIAFKLLQSRISAADRGTGKTAEGGTTRYTIFWNAYDDRIPARDRDGPRCQGERQGAHGAAVYAGPDHRARYSDHHDPNLSAGQGRGAALLLSSEVAGGGQLPHVSSRIWHAGAGTGPQAAPQSGRRTED